MKTIISNKIYYRNAPIRSLDALAKALGISKDALLQIAASGHSLYQRPKTCTTKSDKTVRDTWSVRQPLRGIQDAIKNFILSGVSFPRYITGSIKGGDYKANAAPHVKAAIIITEDIADFFPSTTEENVYQIWRNVFGFADDVSRCLAMLTTKDGFLPQGAPTSSYLANIVFWKHEPKFSEWAAARKLIYTRYVDDITLSSRLVISKNDKTEIVSAIHEFANRAGLRLKRKKHQIATQSDLMIVTKLHVNGRTPTLSQTERSRIRSAVRECETIARIDPVNINLAKKISSAVGRVGKLKRFHQKEATPLLARLKTVRIKIGQ